MNRLAAQYWGKKIIDCEVMVVAYFSIMTPEELFFNVTYLMRKQ